MQGGLFVVVLYFIAVSCDSWAGHYISIFSTSLIAFKTGAYWLVLLWPMLWLCSAYES